jgi:hypothetical protein
MVLEDEDEDESEDLSSGRSEAEQVAELREFLDSIRPEDFNR